MKINLIALVLDMQKSCKPSPFGSSEDRIHSLSWQRRMFNIVNFRITRVSFLP